MTSLVFAGVLFASLGMFAADHYDAAGWIKDCIGAVLMTCIAFLFTGFAVGDTLSQYQSLTLAGIPVSGFIAVVWFGYFVRNRNTLSYGPENWPWYAGPAVAILPVTGAYWFTYLTFSLQTGGYEYAAQVAALLALLSIAAPPAVIAYRAYHNWATVEKPEVSPV